MTTYLVRHAKAGDRSQWDGPDDLRPLSKVGRRQAVGLADELIEGALVGDALRLIDKFAYTHAVLCTHGDVLGNVLENLERRGVPLGNIKKLEKGCTWGLEFDDGEI